MPLANAIGLCRFLNVDNGARLAGVGVQRYVINLPMLPNLKRDADGGVPHLADITAEPAILGAV